MAELDERFAKRKGMANTMTGEETRGRGYRERVRGIKST